MKSKEKLILFIKEVINILPKSWKNLMNFWKKWMRISQRKIKCNKSEKTAFILFLKLRYKI